MKSIEEIITMLISELTEYRTEVESINWKLDYYNEVLGDTSFLLAGLLESLLKQNCSDWIVNKWIDDSLITLAVFNKDKIIIEGKMIWGIEWTTEQWIDPFYFEVILPKGKMAFEKATFYFCDMDRTEISYEEFRNRQNYWPMKIENWRYKFSNFNKKSQKDESC